MNVTEINPYIRYARYLILDKNSCFKQVFPLDARLFYTVKGHGKIKVKATEYEMRPHSLLIINAGVPYCIETPDDPLEYMVLNFDYTQNAIYHNLPVAPVPVQGFKRDMLLDDCAFDDFPALTEALYIREIEPLQKKLAAILDEHIHKILYYENKTGHMLAQCIFECLRILKMGDYGIRKSPVSHILSYIHTNYSTNLTNAAIGERFGYHPNYISFVIKRLTGMSLRRYLIHVRLMHAADLLETGSLSIAEIAEQCGFCDISYFSKCFKKHFDINPSEFRIQSRS